MSRTLFWYLFRDLVRIFLLTSAALAGIMSFGGLLRPLTQHGLDVTQVGRMLAYFTPAMTTYSFPVAALFATTIVYGRMAADNEITACRAGGISYLSMTTPALILGLLVSIASLLLLCYVVPVYNFKVEKVVYSNLARLVQSEIEHNHQLQLADFGIYAQSARVMPPDPSRPDEQHVELIGPIMISYAWTTEAQPHARVGIPTSFRMASRADVYLKREGDQVRFEAALNNGAAFTRDVKSSLRLNLDASQFGPFYFLSPLHEDTRFMPIPQLKDLFNHPERSRQLQDQVAGMVRHEQQAAYLGRVQKALNADGSYRFASEEEAMQVFRGDLAAQLSGLDEHLTLRCSDAPGAAQPRLERELHDRVQSTRSAREMVIQVEPQNGADTPGASGATADDPRLVVSIAAYDVLVETRDQSAAHRATPLELSIPMPPDIAAMRAHDANYFMTAPQAATPGQRQDLRLESWRLATHVQSELHVRASFAVSCLALVLVGCGMGMMFHSGNFLNAMALSFLPAMLTISLIVSGQQICNTVYAVGLGLSFIWAGNVIAGALGIGLLRGCSGRKQIAIMKILDRYVLFNFLKNYLLSCVILIGLYVVLDMLFNFKQLMSVETEAGLTGVTSAATLVHNLTDYYFYQIFVFYAQLSGVIPVAAAAFSLMRMSRCNELCALLSAGVPLLRVSVPIILAAVVLSVVVVVDQELLIPQMIPKLTRAHNEAWQATGAEVYPISGIEDGPDRVLIAGRYTAGPGTPFMEYVSVIYRDKDFMPVAHLTADKAVWDKADGSWTLTNGRFTSGLRAGEETAVKAVDEPYRGTVTPDEIRLFHSRQFVPLLSTQKINQLLARQERYGVNQLLTVKYARFTQPLVNLIALLLAIPCVLTRTPGRLKAAAMRCVGLVGLCMGVAFLGLLLAAAPPAESWAMSWPALMAWLPVLVFGPVSVWLLDRVET